MLIHGLQKTEFAKDTKAKILRMDNSHMLTVLNMFTEQYRYYGRKRYRQTKQR